VFLSDATPNGDDFGCCKKPAPFASEAALVRRRGRDFGTKCIVSDLHEPSAQDIARDPVRSSRRATRSICARRITRTVLAIDPVCAHLALGLLGVSFSISADTFGRDLGRLVSSCDRHEKGAFSDYAGDGLW
jgi:hypothetical protein